MVLCKCCDDEAGKILVERIEKKLQALIKQKKEVESYPFGLDKTVNEIRDSNIILLETLKHSGLSILVKEQKDIGVCRIE